MSTTAIRLDGLWKRYDIHPLHSVWSKGTEALLRLMGKSRPAEDFWALRDVNLSVERGEALGVIGANGAGKSTLLKILCGVTEPTRGGVSVSGRVAPLIELGAGFHPDLTGRENVTINAVMLGMTLREVKKNYDRIVEFSGLKDFMDTPVKKYSSGMFLRLAFSVAVHTEPDLLLVDEILAVGDADFQLRCYNWITEYRMQGRTLVLVSHNESLIAKYCDRALVLAKGSPVFDGLPGDALDSYHAEMAVRAADRASLTPGRGGPTRILAVALRDSDGQECSEFATGGTLLMDVTHETDVDLEGGIICFRIEDAVGTTVFGASMALQGASLPPGPGRAVTRMRMPELPLVHGLYSITVAINDGAERNVAYANRAASLRVRGPRADNRALAGHAYIKHSWERLT